MYAVRLASAGANFNIVREASLSEVSQFVEH